MGGIRFRGLFCFLGFHLLLEYVCPFCHIADDGNGDGTDGTDYKDEGGDSVRSGGSFGLCGVYVHGFDQILVFASAFVFMMVIPGHYLNGMAKQDK